MHTALRTLLGLAFAAIATAGCAWGGGGDKAGGSQAPVVLRLAAADDSGAPPIDRPDVFADEVRRLSKGSLRIDVTLSAGGGAIDSEERVAMMVRDGRYDLGWVPARAWDQLGVTSFEALQAPFLIPDLSALEAVTLSPLAEGMLAGLQAQHLIGLGIVPATMRHPVAYRDPMTRLSDFRGARIWARPSRVTDAVMHALGAIAVHTSSVTVGADAEQGEVDARELAFANANGPVWVTANVTFFGKAITVAGNERAMDRLTDAQRRILRLAARRTAERVADTQPLESEQAAAFCRSGRVALAREGDLAELRRAARPVYAQLERDTEVKATIAAIRRIVATTPRDPAPEVPADCSRPVELTTGRERDPGFLDGTYRWRITRVGAARRGWPESNDVGSVASITLQGGKWIMGDEESGTFKVIDRYLVFDWPRVATVNTFSFTRRSDGTLELEPVLPMDQGDQVVWSAEPWTRVGPPVREIP